MTTFPPRVTTRVGTEYFLILAHDVQRWSYATAREMLLTVLREGIGADAVRRLADSFGFTGDPGDVDGIANTVAEAIASGRLVPVALPQPFHGRPVLYRDDSSDPWATAVPLSSLREETTERFGWVSVELVDHRGVPFANTEVTLVHCDGRRDRVVLDATGRYTARAVAYPGPTRVQLPARLERPQPSTPGLAMDGFQPAAGDITVPRSGAAPVLLSPLDRHYRLVAEPDVRAACVRLVGMLFELNKAFLLPAALEGIRLLAKMYERMPGAEVLVVGHTDRTGKAFRNDSLSLERAEAIIAYMTDDVDAWLAFYGEDADFSRRWGVTEDLLMLSSLPVGQTPYYSEAHSEHSFAAAVRRFQEAAGLVVDGEPGPQTRRAMITQYMALDGTTLPAAVTAVAHGCGEHFAVVPTADGVEELQNRRVEIFFFRDGIAPPPRSKNSQAGDAEYAAWNEAVDEERTFTPSIAGRGRVEVVTDFDVGYAHHAGLIIELRTVDGAYMRRIDPWDTPQSLTELLTFTFEDVPEASFLTCVAITADGQQRTLFEDLPFWEVSLQHGPQDDADPFEVESQPETEPEGGDEP
jgi:outer membrane protein OmpA-like peptidoglycan-associated protein